MKSDLKVILWTAEWCAPCQALKRSKTLEKAIQTLAVKGFGLATLESRDVDAKQWSDESDSQDVQAMPTIDLIRKGKRLARTVGASTERTFVSKWVKALEQTQR